MKIGFNMLLWSATIDERHAPIMQSLRKLGYHGVEIPIFDTSDIGRFRRLASLLDACGLERTAVALNPDERHNAISPSPLHRQGAVDHLRRVIDCAQLLGASVLAGPYYQVLGQFTGLPPSEAELEHAAEVHRVIAPVAAAAGISCAIEPLNRFEAHLLNTCGQAAAYVARVGHHNFGILYDTFHAHIEERDPVRALESLYRAGALKHVHISENDRGTPGRGHARLRESIRALKRIGYDGWLTIEAFGSAVPELVATTRVWRDLFTDAEQVYTEGYALINETWRDA